MTNYDRIHNMSKEDMEEYFSNMDKVCEMCSYHEQRDLCGSKPCEYGIKQWLSEEVKE